MKVLQVSGKRKRAVARARLKDGKGVIRLNTLALDGVSPELVKLMIMEPVMLAGDLAKNVDIDVRVHGGGWHSQAEAARLVVARALVLHSGSKALKQKYLDYDRHLLVADTRRAEHSKPNDSKPRAKRQKSYR